MNCKSVQSNLSAYLDRELSGEEMLEIREHLVRCESCREEEFSLRSLKRLIGGLDAPEPTPDFEERLIRNLRTARVPARRFSLSSSLAVFGGVAAGAMAVTLAILAVTGRGPVSAEPAPNIAYEAQRYHEIYTAGDSAYGGGPVISAANYEAR